MGLEGRRSLFISYNGMLEPLGQTQVIPYLCELAKRGVKVTLLSFEKPQAFTPEGRTRCEQLQEDLLANGIEWHRLRYHQWPSLPATAFDVIVGARYAKRLVRKNKIELVHARGHIPATIALFVKRSTKVKMIFDLRGLMAEEYVDAEHWEKDGLPYRITKATERRILRATDAIVTLTERIWPIIKEWDGLRNRTVAHSVIPCCVNLSVFKFCDDQRAQRRAELGLTNEFVIVYSGSLDGWYLTGKMADFLETFLELQPNGHLLWLTTGSHGRVRELMSKHSIPESKYSVRAVTASEVSSYLSAADVPIAFIKPCFSKLASSPTKNGEYLACGLPLVLNAGIGDSDALVEEYKTGVLVRELDKEHYRSAVSEISSLVKSPETKARCRTVATELFDLFTVGAERYAALYETVLDKKNGIE